MSLVESEYQMTLFAKPTYQKECSCKSCFHWGMNERGEVTRGCIPTGKNEPYRKCLKQSKNGNEKHVRASFVCGLYAPASEMYVKK